MPGTRLRLESEYNELFVLYKNWNFYVLTLYKILNNTNTLLNLRLMAS
jgi:hypothetical protein